MNIHILLWFLVTWACVEIDTDSFLLLAFLACADKELWPVKQYIMPLIMCRQQKDSFTVCLHSPNVRLMAPS